MSFRFIALALTIAAASAAPALAATEHSDIAWTDYLRATWPVIAAAVGLIITGAVLALGTRFASIGAFNKLKSRLVALEGHRANHDARIVRLEEIAVTSPTRQELQDDIGSLSERMRGVEAQVSGLNARFETLNDYLQMLIERGLK